MLSPHRKLPSSGRPRLHLFTQRLWSKVQCTRRCVRLCVRACVCVFHVVGVGIGVRVEGGDEEIMDDIINYE